MDKLSGFILSFDIARTSNFAAAALGNLHVRIWKVDSGEYIHELIFQEAQSDQLLKVEGDLEPMSVRFSPDGLTLAVSYLSRIHLYDTRTWQEEKSLGVTGEDDLRADVEDALKAPPSDTPQLKHRTAEQAAADKNDTQPVINRRLREWSEKRKRGDGRTRITDFAFTPDGNSIVASYCRGGCYASSRWRIEASSTANDPVRLWDIRSSQVVWESLYDPKGVIDRIVPSPDGKHFAADNKEPGKCAVGFYELRNGAQIAMLPFGSMCNPSPNIVFLSDGRSVLINRAERNTPKKHPWEFMAIYDSDSGKMIVDLPQRNGVRSADISSNGLWLATTLWSGLRFQIWIPGRDQPLFSETPREWKWRGPVIDRVRFSPDGRWLVVGSDGTGELVVYQLVENNAVSP